MAAAQGCEDCRDLKKEYRDSALARYTPAPASPTAVPKVQVVLYWSKGCGHCEEVLEGVLPELQEKHGAQLEVRLVEVVSMEDISAFFDVAEGYGYARGRAAVPFLLIGDRALMGVDQISSRVAGLDRHLFGCGRRGLAKPEGKRGARAADSTGRRGLYRWYSVRGRCDSLQRVASRREVRNCHSGGSCSHPRFGCGPR